jgi:hypothetical protein
MRLDLSMRNRRLDVPKGDGSGRREFGQNRQEKASIDHRQAPRLECSNAILGPRFGGLSTRRPRRPEDRVLQTPTIPTKRPHLPLLDSEESEAQVLEGAIIRLKRISGAFGTARLNTAKQAK